MPDAALDVPVTTLKEVIAAVRAARPALDVPAAVRRAEIIPADSWDLALWRDLHQVLTSSWRGLVEDAGYDPDMLPAPPREERTLALVDGALRLTAPDADTRLTDAVKAIPGLAWNGTDRHWTIPVTGAGLPALRTLVKDHRVIATPDAIETLRAKAAAVAADPDEAAYATVDVTGGRVVITPVAAFPPLADELKRVPSLKWDGTALAFTAPAARLRDVLAAVKKYPVKVGPGAHAALTNLDAPLVYDGTLDGLRGVPITDLHGIDGKKAEKFTEFGLGTVFDLLMLTPRKYLDRSNLRTIRSLQAGEEVGLLATIAAIVPDQRKRMVRFTVTDGTGKIGVTFFNAFWQAKRFRVGDEVALYGKVEAWTGSGRSILSLNNPIMDPVGDDTLPVVPIYPQSAKSRITTWELSSAAAQALRRLGTLTDPLPDEVIAAHNLMPRQAALVQIHRPDNLDQAAAARTRLAFDELLRMQTALLLNKTAEESETGITHTPTGVLTSQLVAGLPYPLTGAQTRALAEIDANMRAPHPMHRLLQGDVGSGKSLLAFLSLLTGVEGGYQGALMAPTEILASQLYRELADRTAGLTAADGTPVRVEFFSNKLRGKTRDAALADLASGAINIAVGTHALLVEDVTFHNLGVVVVDEQHRFGVEQRAKLRDKGPTRSIDGKTLHVRPDMLVMTATPIPRTAAITVFGDLDVSVLDELPPGRTPIATTWIDAEPDLEHATASPWAEIRAQVAAGRQAYVVCPLVEESEKLEAASAVETFDLLRLGALAGLRLGLVHGQQKPDERAETMTGFRTGDLDVLVATTVIEVGVNVPNATVITILDSGRFGIAQLHQLRGRVGRGVHASECVLVGRCRSTDARARMQALVDSTDGFYLSEVDLALRGHGQMFGAAQSGQSDLRVADLDTDRDLLVGARLVAQSLLADDPRLARRPALKAEITAVLDPDARVWLSRS